MTRPGVLVSSDCRDGKHGACTGDGWHPLRDVVVACPCGCHVERCAVCGDPIEVGPVVRHGVLVEHRECCEGDA